jgi:glucans biosynthesis protein
MPTGRAGTSVVVIVALGAALLATTSPAFDFNDVIAKAKALAQRAYQAPPGIPQALRNLSYDQYQGIRFRPDRSLWRASGSNFQVMLVPPGLYYTQIVTINVVDAEGVHEVPFHRADFDFASPDVKKLVPNDLGYAGFKLTFPWSDSSGVTSHQFLVFAGVSYFRAVGRDNVFGLSARGIAVDTGLPSGEEFPSFTEFWLVRPSPTARTAQLYGLLEGKSLAGAYWFIVTPGAATVLRVGAVLFPRTTIQLAGIAPLTSMFYYGENTPRPPGEWRPQVHDSDGLLLHDGSTGEWLWRPLINPRRLTMDQLQTQRLGGFGLIQRQTSFTDYEDPGALYGRRPSAWVEPRGDWGKGGVELVQLPARNETSDNIVAFWTPAAEPKAGERLSFSYRLSFGSESVAGEPMGRAAKTYVGNGNVMGGGDVAGAYRVIVDFEGGPLAELQPDAAVDAVITPEDGGQVLEHHVEYLQPAHRWRLSILARPASGKSLALRAFLKHGGATLTETWTYRLPPDNGIIGGA